MSGSNSGQEGAGSGGGASLLLVHALGKADDFKEVI
jgi:hypothetical protein